MAAATHDLMTTYVEADGLALADLVHRREVSPHEVVETAITVIEKLNPQLNAVIHRLYDMGRQRAGEIDLNAPFAGVPFLLKELASSWQGAPLTNSSAYLKDVIADSDSEVVRRMKQAGLVLVGKSNAPENGWSIATEPKLFGKTINPWNPAVTPGGSSGGTCAAVAARMVPIGEASDGAGSIRIPSSCCGTVGLKPSRGRVTIAPTGDFWYGSAYFLCATRSVRDTAAYLDAVAGALPGDAYSPPVSNESWLSACQRLPKRLRIGYTVSPPNGTAIDPQVKAAVLQAVSALEEAGYAVEEHDMPLDADAAWRTYTDMTCVQTAALYQWLEPLVARPVTRDDVEPVTWAIIERGRATSGIKHIGDVEQVRRLSRQIATDLDPFDIFITPTLTQLPRPVGYYDMSETDIDRYNAKWTDSVFAFPFNISGQPAISLPTAMAAEGIPIGVQLVGRYGDEATVLAVSALLESKLPWAHRKPPISA